MTQITRETHDNCLALIRALKARDPALTARAMARGTPITIGSPESNLGRDIAALNDVASAFATGVRPSLRSLRRVEKLLAAELTLQVPAP